MCWVLLYSLDGCAVVVVLAFGFRMVCSVMLLVVICGLVGCLLVVWIVDGGFSWFVGFDCLGFGWVLRCLRVLCLLFRLVGLFD